MMADQSNIQESVSNAISSIRNNTGLTNLSDYNIHKVTPTNVAKDIISSTRLDSFERSAILRGFRPTELARESKEVIHPTEVIDTDTPVNTTVGIDTPDTVLINQPNNLVVGGVQIPTESYKPRISKKPRRAHFKSKSAPKYGVPDQIDNISSTDILSVTDKSGKKSMRTGKTYDPSDSSVSSPKKEDVPSALNKIYNKLVENLFWTKLGLRKKEPRTFSNAVKAIGRKLTKAVVPKGLSTEELLLGIGLIVSKALLAFKDEVFGFFRTSWIDVKDWFMEVLPESIVGSENKILSKVKNEDGSVTITRANGDITDRNSDYSREMTYRREGDKIIPIEMIDRKNDKHVKYSRNGNGATDGIIDNYQYNSLGDGSRYFVTEKGDQAVRYFRLKDGKIRAVVLDTFDDDGLGDSDYLSLVELDPNGNARVLKTIEATQLEGSNIRGQARTYKVTNDDVRNWSQNKFEEWFNKYWTKDTEKALRSKKDDSKNLDRALDLTRKATIKYVNTGMTTDTPMYTDADLRSYLSGNMATPEGATSFSTFYDYNPILMNQSRDIRMTGNNNRVQSGKNLQGTLGKDGNTLMRTLGIGGANTVDAKFDIDQKVLAEQVPEFSPTITYSDGGESRKMDWKSLSQIISGFESRFNYRAKNPMGSATGKYQFTKSTWEHVRTKYPSAGLIPWDRDKITDGSLEMRKQQEAAGYYLALDLLKSMNTTKIKHPVKGTSVSLLEAAKELDYYPEQLVKGGWFGIGNLQSFLNYELQAKYAKDPNERAKFIGLAGSMGEAGGVKMKFYMNNSTARQLGINATGGIMTSITQDAQRSGLAIPTTSTPVANGSNNATVDSSTPGWSVRAMKDANPTKATKTTVSVSPKIDLSNPTKVVAFGDSKLTQTNNRSKK